MPEPVEAWWARRQWSKRQAVPYAVGAFRPDWERYPVLVRQYHPELNGGVTLTQIPPAADVWLLWECEVGHRFVATPWEQRQRPGRSRRRSTWCPECAARAVPKTPRRSTQGQPNPRQPVSVTSPPRRARPAVAICGSTPSLAVGTAFHSGCAPRAASAAEELLRAKLSERISFDKALNAIVVGQPFFAHFEVWPDIVLPEFRVAIEYDTTGRDGLEHVGTREQVDKRKDRLLRRAGWEVVRVRCAKLRPLGPWDVAASGHISAALIDRLIDRLREIRGDLIVDSYLADACR